jgi:hypothetical protein
VKVRAVAGEGDEVGLGKRDRPRSKNRGEHCRCEACSFCAPPVKVGFLPASNQDRDRGRPRGPSAESARGISPRAAHRTVRDSLPSHGSCHSSRAAALRHKPVGSSRYRLTKSIMTRMTRPLRSTGITPLHRYYGAVRPWLAHRYFRPRGANRLRLFPCHRQPGSQVPYESLDQIHAPCTPDIAGSVSRFLPCCSQSWEATLVLMPSMVFRCVLPNRDRSSSTGLSWRPGASQSATAGLAGGGLG